MIGQRREIKLFVVRVTDEFINKADNLHVNLFRIRLVQLNLSKSFEQMVSFSLSVFIYTVKSLDR